MPFGFRSLSFRYAKSESSLTTKHTKIGQAGIRASPINNNVETPETPKKCTYKGKAALSRQKSSSYKNLSNPNDLEKLLLTKSASFQSVPTSNMVSKPNFALNESLNRNGLFNKQKQLNNKRSLSVDQLNIPEGQDNDSNCSANSMPSNKAVSSKMFTSHAQSYKCEIGGIYESVETVIVTQKDPFLSQDELDDVPELSSVDGTKREQSKLPLMKRMISVSRTFLNKPFENGATHTLRHQRKISKEMISTPNLIETSFSNFDTLKSRSHGMLTEVEDRDGATHTLPQQRKISKQMISTPYLLETSLSNFDKLKSRSDGMLSEIDDCRYNDELISSIKIEEEAVDPSTRPQKFPNDEIKLRKKTGPNAVRAKTLNYDFTSSARTNEVKGVTKIVIGDDCCAKVGANNKLFFEDNEIKIVNGLTGKHEVLKRGVEVKQVVLKSDRKCVEVYDCENGRYELHFDSAKDAKSFADSESFRDNAYNERTPIKTKLLRLLGKRSSREILMEKGILRNEQIFGNTIHNVYQMQRCVPEYLTKSIQLIEKPQNISSMGIYRTSGNLATIQKIRCEVDRGKMSILNDYAEDVDVLTGCVKLFFRELKEPLIPLNISDELLHISGMKPKEVWNIIEKLPKPNFDTLMCLIRHLLNVDEFKELNKMDIYNLSICWGPSLMFIPESCCNIVVQSTNNSKVLELLLTFYKNNPNELGACEAAVYNKVLSHPVENKGSTKKTEIFVKGHKKSSSYNNINVVYDAVLKLVELIEAHMKTEGLYKKHGTKVDKVIDKINKRKFNELHKYHVHDFTGALKKYVNDLNEPLMPKEIFEEFNCDTFQYNIAKQKLKNKVETLGRKDTLVVLLRHLVKVTETEKDNKVTFESICDEWKHVLIRTVGQEDVVKTKLLTMLMELYGDLQQAEVAKPMAMPDVIKDIEARSRFSKYDNISSTGHQRYDVRGQAKILEEKTDN